jgi:hypothetical protein
MNYETTLFDFISRLQLDSSGGQATIILGSMMALPLVLALPNMLTGWLADRARQI